MGWGDIEEKNQKNIPEGISTGEEAVQLLRMSLTTPF